MPTLEEVKAQLQATDGYQRFWGKREIKELPNILWDNETVQRLISGTYGNKIGVLVATDRRLIFIDKGMMFGLTVEDFPYDKITSIQYETGLIMGKLTIFASGNKAEIKQVEKAPLRQFAEEVRARISGGSVSGATAPVPPSHVNGSANGDAATSGDVVARLAKAKAMLEQGLISQDEFDAVKAKILSSI